MAADNGKRREREAAQISPRDVPMRQGEIRGRRAANFDRILLLHELPGSRSSVRAAGFRAARARFRRWNGHGALSKGSGAMLGGAAVSQRASAQARFPHATGYRHGL